MISIIWMNIRWQLNNIVHQTRARRHGKTTLCLLYYMNLRVQMIKLFFFRRLQIWAALQISSLVGLTLLDQPSPHLCPVLRPGTLMTTSQCHSKLRIQLHHQLIRPGQLQGRSYAYDFEESDLSKCTVVHFKGSCVTRSNPARAAQSLTSWRLWLISWHRVPITVPP